MACGNPHKADRALSYTGDEPSPSPEPSPPGPMKVEIFTVGDMARAMRINSGYILLASQACVRHSDCLKAEGKSFAPFPQCEEGLLLHWCPPGQCQGGLGKMSVRNTCIRSVRERACEDLAQVIECPELQSYNQELRITDWPVGEIPEYDLDHAYEEMIRRATSHSQDPTSRPD